MIFPQSFAESSPNCILGNYFSNIFPSGGGGERGGGRLRRPPPLKRSALLAQPLRRMFSTHTLAAYFLDGNNYYKKNNWQPRGTQLLKTDSEPDVLVNQQQNWDCVEM